MEQMPIDASLASAEVTTEDQPKNFVCTREETEKLPAGKPKPKAPVQVRATDQGALIGTTLDEQYRLAKAYHASGMLPNHYDSPEKILTGMQYAFELGLKPMTGMRQICVINGTPAIWGELPLALVKKSGLYEYIKETWIKDDKGEIIGAQCETKRKNEPEPIIRSFTVADAKKARLWGKSGPWSLYPTRMLQMRARSWALKDAYPDVLSGISIAEYDYNLIPEESKNIRDVSHTGQTQNRAADVNALLGIQMSYSLHLIIPGLPKPVNQTTGKHWRHRYKNSKAWKETVGYHCLGLEPEMPLLRAKLTLIRRSSRCPDSDGLVSSFKPVIDGLVDAEIIADDTYKIIGMPEYKWEQVKPNDGHIEIIVEEMDNGST